MVRFILFVFCFCLLLGVSFCGFVGWMVWYEFALLVLFSVIVTCCLYIVAFGLWCFDGCLLGFIAVVCFAIGNGCLIDLWFIIIWVIVLLGCVYVYLIVLLVMLC